VSSPRGSVDIERFEQQVASITDQLEAVWTGDEALRSRQLGALAMDDKDQVVEDVLNQLYTDATTKAEVSLGSKDEVRTAALEAKAALQTPAVRQTLCRILRPITGKSSREMAVELAKAGLPLALTGQLAVPAAPLVWGLLGFTAAWLGVTWLCRDQD
jgi:hypothetical protein